MEIMQVMGRLVCTQRVEGLGHMNLRILRNNHPKKLPVPSQNPAKINPTLHPVEFITEFVAKVEETTINLICF